MYNSYIAIPSIADILSSNYKKLSFLSEPVLEKSRGNNTFLIHVSDISFLSVKMMFIFKTASTNTIPEKPRNIHNNAMVSIHIFPNHIIKIIFEGFFQ